MRNRHTPEARHRNTHMKFSFGSAQHSIILAVGPYHRCKGHYEATHHSPTWFLKLFQVIDTSADRAQHQLLVTNDDSLS